MSLIEFKIGVSFTEMEAST